MRERLERLLGAGAAAIWVSTFHSACVRSCAARPRRAGLGRDFVIYDDDRPAAAW